MKEETVIQIASRVSGAVVDIIEIRDPADGSHQFAIRYVAGDARWISSRYFHDREQAYIAGLAVADFSGGEFRT